MTARGKISAAVAVASVLALAGCGGGHPDRPAIVALVNDFAASHDSRACDLMTGNELADVYGSGNAKRGRAQCIAASKGFRPGPVDILQVKSLRNGGVTVIARNRQTGRHYTVTLTKTANRWLIDHLTSP